MVKRMMVSRRLAFRIFAGILAVSVMGCAEDSPPPPPTPEEVVRERAQAWADALLAKDLEAAYQFTSPNYRQFSAVGKDHARVAGAGNWREAEVTEVDCSEQTCEVQMIVKYYIPQLKMVNETRLEYRWVQLDGEWWLYVPAS
jgi:hypothetical protein